MPSFRRISLQQEYGVTALTLFGSTARGSDTPESDIDLFVEMPPQGLKLVNLQFYLENLLTSKVDLVRRHSHIDPFFGSVPEVRGASKGRRVPEFQE